MMRARQSTSHVQLKRMQNTSSQESPPYAGYRILVADDNAINVQIAKRLLEKLGCAVDLASSGKEALAMHTQQPYDLILLDCQMPDLDGYRACSILRRDEKPGRHTPIIGWTANADQEELDRCHAAGMDDCLSKHLHLDGLSQMLGTWLKPGAAPLQHSHPSDLSGLETMHRISGESFAELVTLFEEDMPQRIANLKQAFQNGDYHGGERIAHMMSGCCASIGAMHLSDLCQQMEMLAKRCQTEAWMEKLEEIEAGYRQVHGTLRAMLRGSSA